MGGKDMEGKRIRPSREKRKNERRKKGRAGENAVWSTEGRRGD